MFSIWEKSHRATRSVEADEEISRHLMIIICPYDRISKADFVKFLRTCIIPRLLIQMGSWFCVDQEIAFLSCQLGNRPVMQGNDGLFPYLILGLYEMEFKKIFLQESGFYLF